MTVEVQGQGQTPEPDPTVSPLWCRHTILAYVRPVRPTMTSWTEDDFKWLIAYHNSAGNPEDFFFDAFLFLGFSCKDGRHLLGITSRKPAIKSDWQAALTRYLEGVQVLDRAFGDVAATLGRTDTKAKVILAMPYPDPRQSAFGDVGGKQLDLKQADDRIRAMKWYIDGAVAKWAELEAQGLLKHTRLVGFYWGNEGIGGSVDDIIRATSELVHAKGCLLHWIPCFGGARADWRELGLDCLTQQINYQNPQEPGRPLDIFELMTNLVADRDIHGVEMTPMARETHLNPRIWCWQQVFLANLDAALRLNWDRYPAMTYFHGNDLAKIAADPKSHVFYEKLYRWTQGELTRTQVDALADVVLDELLQRGHIDAGTRAEIAAAGTVLAKLHLMEEPKLEAQAKAIAERLTPYSQSSGNLFADTSFEAGTDDWPVCSADVERSEDTARNGRWSLKLTLPADAGSGMILKSAKSARFAVQPGQLVRLSAWVNTPQDLRSTTRGLVLGLARYSGGNMTVAWSDCEIRQVSASGGWKQLSVHLFVDDKPCEEVLAIIGLCGGGVAYVDDVELVTLIRPE